MSAKWTRGELLHIVDENLGGAALEVVRYLCERGPGVVDWGDNRNPEREEDERIERELRAADEADGIR